ncbi:MAG: TSCPD domain-containing protein, partial [Acidisphaera sp.]|nr:TSCPD domain-containing protein [Acidisphaera sp.]
MARNRKQRPIPPFWHGVRLCTIAAAADPDSVSREVRLPALWEESAAAALAAMLPGRDAVSLIAAAEAWIGRLDDADLADRLRVLLLTRRGAPGPETWRGECGGEPRFLLNLPAFRQQDGGGFDVDGFAAAAQTAATALGFLHPEAERIAVGFADLAGLLALLGIAYDSPAARGVAAALAALMRAMADCGSARVAEAGGPTPGRPAPIEAPPARTAIPGLAEAAAAAQQLAAGLPQRRHCATTGWSEPGAAEALLGVETGGVAPAFSLVDEAGALTRATRAMLAGSNVSAETMLAD